MKHACPIILLLSLLGSGASAQVDPASGIDFVTIGNPGNAPWMGNGTPDDQAIGHGTVDYSYKIGRFEVTTAQWCEFINCALDRPANDRIPYVFAPTTWGAQAVTPQNTGAQRYAVPAGREMFAAGGVDWRTCAILCNWLSNGKRTDRAAFANGAYDVSTFGYRGASSIFTDQLAHNPGAQYYIPSWNEALKATYYDPNRYGDGQPGWWTWANKKEVPPAYGPPGVHVNIRGPVVGPDPNGPLAEANGAWNATYFPGYSPFSVPLGAYPASLSPWGLLDTAGGTSEWTEDAILTSGIWPTGRVAEGSPWQFVGDAAADFVGYPVGGLPTASTLNFGFRIASVIPAPSSCIMLGVAGTIMARSRRRYPWSASLHCSLRCPSCGP